MAEWPITADEVWRRVEITGNPPYWSEKEEKEQLLVPADLAEELYEALVNADAICFSEGLQGEGVEDALARYKREIGK